MFYKKYLLCLGILICIMAVCPLSANANETVFAKIDIQGAVKVGNAVLTSTEFDIGDVNACFDGSTGTLMRTPGISPAYVQVAFKEKRSISKIRVLLGEIGYPDIDKNDWWAEAADNQSDMDNKSGSYLLLMNTRTGVAGNWDEILLPKAIEKKIYRVWINRKVGDGYVHIPEIEFYGNINIDEIHINTEELSIPNDGIGSLKCVGLNNILHESYDITDKVTWEYNKAIIDINANGQVNGKQIGSTSITAKFNTMKSSNHCSISVYRLLESPKNIKTEAYYSTAILKWSKIINPYAAGYAVYRKVQGKNNQETLAGRICNNYDSDEVIFNDYGLTPNAIYEYRVAAYDSLKNISSKYTESIIVKTSNTKSNLSKAVNLKLLTIIYTSGLSEKDINKTIESTKKGIEFFYRNSEGSLNLDTTFMRIDTVCPDTKGPTLENVEQDLRVRGVFDNEYDLFFLVSNNLPEWSGGWIILGDTYGGMAYYDHNDPSPYWKDCEDGKLSTSQITLFIHELGHAVDGLSDSQGFYMMFNHPPWAFPINEGYSLVAGEGFDNMSQILRQFKDYYRYKAPHNDYIEYVDSDQDKLADDDTRLPIDEKRYRTDRLKADTDSDMLNDFHEYTAGSFTGPNPLLSDTDNDGTIDGNDVTPFCDMSPYIVKIPSGVEINGKINSSWTKLASKPSFQNDETLNTEFYAGWDDNYLYIGTKSNKKIKIWFSLDGSGQNGRWETDGVFPGYSDWSKYQFTDKAYGDCYSGDAVLIIDPDLGKVFKGKDGNFIQGAAVSCIFSDGKWSMTCRIPKNLGPGIGFSYWKEGTPIINGLRLEKGKIFGLQFTYAPVGSGTTLDEWFGEWSSLAEVYHYYLSTLVDIVPPRN